MKKEKFIQLFALATLLLISFFACKRELNFPKSDDPIKQTRYWFNKTYDKELKLSRDGKLIGGNNYPDWRFVKMYPAKGRGFDIIETPLFENIRHKFGFADDNQGQQNLILKSSIRKLIIFKKGNRFRDVIMTVVARKSYLDKHIDLSNITIENIPLDFSGSIFFETFKGDLLKAVMITEGKIISIGKIRKIDNSSAQQNTMSVIPTWIENCASCENIIMGSGDVMNSPQHCQDIESTCGGYTYDPEQLGNDCANGIYAAFCDCSGDVANCLLDLANGSTGTDPYAAADNAWLANGVIDSTANHCVDSVLKRLGRITEKLPHLIRDYFGQTQTPSFSIKLKMYYSSTASGTNKPDAAYTDILPTNNIYTIYLNSFYSNATDLSIATTIMHEALHCQLIQWLRNAVIANDTLAQQQLAQNYGYVFTPDFASPASIYQIATQATTQHDAMATAYRTLISEALQEYATANNINISLNNCQILSWAGLFESAAFNNLTLTNQNWYQEKINAEKDPYSLLPNINVTQTNPYGHPCN